MDRRILIIDDEKPTLNMFRLFLTALGYSVFTAENGPDGLEKFEQEKPPVVLTDVKMPGMSGIEVLERIKKLAPETEVIVITGHGDMEMAIQALNLDATDFINKPVQRRSLDQALKRAEDRIRKRGTQPGSIKTEIRKGVGLIHVDADPSGNRIAQLQAAFEQADSAAAKGIIFSFDESVTIHGGTLEVIIGLLRTADERSRRTGLAGIPDNFLELFKTAGLPASIEVFEDLDQALEAFE